MLKLTVGPMFSGKTTRLIDLFENDPDNTLVFKPMLDNRSEPDTVQTHVGAKCKAIPIHKPSEIIEHLSDNNLQRKKIEMILIDEIQFFCKDIVRVCNELAETYYIHGFGLDVDAQEQPFGYVGELMALADSVEKITGKCVSCSRPSTRTFKLSPDKQIIDIGAAEKYIPLCKSCYVRRAMCYHCV
jgi:thymidine kinase